MLKKIEALRKQPKVVRNRYAFGVALSVTLLIAIVWTISLPSRLTSGTTVVKKDDPESQSLTDQLSILKDIVGESIDDIKTQAELISSESTATTTAEALIATTTVSSNGNISANNSTSTNASTTAEVATSTIFDFNFEQ